MRVAAVQLKTRAVETIAEFERTVEFFVDTCAEYDADFCVFPEMFTVPLLALEKRKLNAEDSIATLTRHTKRFVNFMSALAVRYNINIIGGSHPTETDDGDIQNVAYVFLRDGSIHTQEKSTPHPTSASGGISRAATRWPPSPPIAGPSGC